MSTNTTKVKKRTLKVTPSSRAVNCSASGRVNHSTTHISSVSVFLAGDSKVLDKGPVQTPRQTLRVFDETGNDVTPRPLYQLDPGAMPTKHSKVFVSETSAATTSDFLSTLFQTTTNTSFAGPFTRSVFGSSTESRSSQSTMESMNDEIDDPSSKQDVPTSLSDVHVQREEVKEQVREDMLDDVVDCCITETDTVVLLDMPGISVSVDADDAEAVSERNNLYAELCRNRMGNDKYTERSMQTFNGALKNKEVQSDRTVMVDAATSATIWDMYDSFCGTEQAGTGVTPNPDKAGYPEGIMDTGRGPDKTMSVVSTASRDDVRMTGMYLSPATTSSSTIETETFTVRVEDEPDPGLILQSEKFLYSLLVMERTILENIFQPKLAAYRQLPTLEDPDSVVKPKAAGQRGEDEESFLTPVLERLWVFSCELTVGHNVSCMAWNKKNPDLLAVGYGEFDFKEQKPGLVCCWSLKNPTWPERVFHCDSGVTALDFSASNASQLAVGLQDGSIAAYDVQSREKTPVIDSSECAHKHTSPVWQLRWIEQERGLLGEEKREALISISADGRISKWFLHKGFDCIDLMKLKRIHNEKTQVGEKDRKTEAFISRLAPGLCFDFHPMDSNIYLAGTEEGHIHKCSCSNNEQFLETYRAHVGPVSRITWSPFCPDVFLSCSYDWTVQLWRQDLCEPVLAFTSTQRAVHEVTWSPNWATVFGAINEGQVEIWDLASSILDPTAVCLAGPGVKLSSLLFARQTDCILVGDSDGQVSVYQLKNFAAGRGDQVDTLEDIISSALASQL